MKINDKGMTLIEVIIAGAISVIIAGIGFSLFIMYMGETRESSANQKMQRQAETVMETIARTVRNSSLILAPDDVSPTVFICDTTAGATKKTCQEIRMYLGTTLQGGFRVSSGKLQELDFPDDPDTWKEFEAGGGTVILDTSSSFTMSTCRNRLEIDLTFKTFAKDTFYLYTRKGLFLCRN